MEKKTFIVGCERNPQVPFGTTHLIIKNNCKKPFDIPITVQSVHCEPNFIKYVPRTIPIVTFGKSFSIEWN